jgi:hypothetical protein
MIVDCFEIAPIAHVNGKATWQDDLVSSSRGIELDLTTYLPVHGGDESEGRKLRREGRLRTIRLSR